jgi:hypothetical protein
MSRVQIGWRQARRCESGHRRTRGRACQTGRNNEGWDFRLRIRFWLVASAITLGCARRAQPLETACGCVGVVTTQLWRPVASNGDVRQAAEPGIHYH